MGTVLTRAEAAGLLAVRAAEREKIQANLLDLDGSFGKRLLAGASLVGSSKARWQAASAELASVWEVFTAYSAVLTRAAAILDATRRPSEAQLAEITALLTEPSAALARAQVPLAQRLLTEDCQEQEKLTLAAAVQRMTAAFSQIAALVSAAESVWTEVSDRLDQIGSVLGPAIQHSAGVADDALTGMLDSTDAELHGLRDLLNRDPLSLWQDDRVNTAPLNQLLEHAQAAATRADELSRLREDADSRIAAAARAVVVAQACEQDAQAAREEAMRKVDAGQLPAAPPGTAGLNDRMASLGALKAEGRWPRLAAELEAIMRESSAAAGRWRDAAKAAQDLLDRRAELRGLLGAYHAKAARLGGAEDTDLAGCYQLAHDLLWSAPCDLAAAADAVHGYQRKVQAFREGAS